MYRISRLATICLFIAIAILAPLACGSVKQDTRSKELIRVTHIVHSGETINGIAAEYCPPDYSYTERRQFEYDIINTWNKELFKRRIPGEIYPGDHLLIQFYGVISVD